MEAINPDTAAPTAHEKIASLRAEQLAAAAQGLEELCKAHGVRLVPVLELRGDGKITPKLDIEIVE